MCYVFRKAKERPKTVASVVAVAVICSLLLLYQAPILSAWGWLTLGRGPGAPLTWNVNSCNWNKAEVRHVIFVKVWTKNNLYL